MAVCPNCGEDNPDRFRFCGVCGRPLLSTPSEEERKVVTVLFVDLVGFTARSDRADPEDVRATLRPYHALLRREIDRWGGTLEKFIGDAAMAVFGAPVAHEDDAERAVRAVLRILEAIPELNEEHPGLDLAVRAGIDTGEAVVALGARPEEGEGIVAGDVVNTAARLQSEAPVQGIVVGEVTHRTTKHVIEYEELAPVTVKGKAQPVPIWRAVGARSRFGIDLERPRTPFIGRDDDLALVTQAYHRALREQSLQLVTIAGEPGVGKTRLVTELRNYVDDRPEVVFWRQGRCLPYGDGISFWALGEIVKSHASILESDGPEEAAAKLSEAVDLVVEDDRDRDWLRARLAPLIGAAEAAATVERDESFAAWRTFLEAVAAARPLVITVEDLHWADEAMLAFLEHLVDWSSDAPLFLVCTARPELYERHPNWGGGKRNSATVSLSPLSDEDTARLIAALLEQTVLPAETQQVLLDRAGGNPLYAEEFIRMLIDREILTREQGLWTIPDEAEIPVPESVHALIAARLDTLPPERKALLQDAAVVGKVFWSGAVAFMASSDETAVRETMHELARKELVRPARRSSVEDQAEYAFWHALIRDVAYGQIPRVARVEKHRTAAAWIERLAGARVADVAELLAHHYAEALDLAASTGSAGDVADLEDNARRFLVLAGDRVRHLDPRKAESHYRRALELIPTHDPDWPDVLTKAADAAFEAGTGTIPDLERDYARAIDAYRTQGDMLMTGHAMARLSFPVWAKGEGTRAIQLASDAITLLEGEPPGPELASAYASLAGRLTMSGDPEGSLRFSEKALTLAGRLGLRRVTQRALQNRGMDRCDLGDLAGMDDLREALDLGVEIGLGLDTANAHINLSFWVWLAEGPAPSLALHREAIEFGRRRGLSTYRWATGELCWMLYDSGEWEELLHTAETVREWDQAARARGTNWQPGVMALTMRALVDAQRGAIAEADSAREQILSRTREIGDPQVLVPGLATAAVIAESAGSPEAAVGLLAELRDATRHRSPVARAWRLTEIARTGVSAGVPEIVRDFLDGLDVVTARHRNSVLTAEATLTEAAGQLDDALDLHGRAAARWREYGHVPETGFALLGSGRCLVGLARPTEATPALREARSIFVGLGAEPLVAEADEWLTKATALSS